jgi:hypothetical protein
LLVSTDNIYRARKGGIKGIEAVGSIAITTKRGAMGDQVSARKRQKTRTNSDQESQDTPEYEQVKDQRRDRVFPFMDLPGGK